MKTNKALETLRHYVTGAIERGETVAIVEETRKYWYETITRADTMLLLSGPYNSHEESASHHDAVVKKTVEYDQTTWFDLFGTASFMTDQGKGILERKFGDDWRTK